MKGRDLSMCLLGLHISTEREYARKWSDIVHKAYICKLCAEVYVYICYEFEVLCSDALTGVSMGRCW